MSLRVSDIERCLHGIIPSAIATADRNAVPNVSYVSHVEPVDENHVALSCQFFNKTRQNVAENPRASLFVNDPLDFSAYRLDLVYRRSEEEGALYDHMKTRIEAIAAHTGMTGVFRLLSADVYEVQAVVAVDSFLEPAAPGASIPEPEPLGPLTELRALQTVSHRINAATHLEDLIAGVLTALDECFGFEHSMLLLANEGERRLVAIGSHGYGSEGIGAQVRIGDGLIGKAAEERHILRTLGMGAELRYARAVRDRARTLGHACPQGEVPLPGLPDAQSQMALPLCIEERLVGVLAVESAHPLRFEQWHEAFLDLVGNQLALALERWTLPKEPQPKESQSSARDGDASSTSLELVHYAQDDSVFACGEYLVRGLPGRILWKLLTSASQTGQTEFSNRELRLDASLGLPAIKDNLESRLLLLRRRLEEKRPEIRIIPIRRGRFRVEVPPDLRLEERD